MTNDIPIYLARSWKEHQAIGDYNDFFNGRRRAVFNAAPGDFRILRRLKGAGVIRYQLRQVMIPRRERAAIEVTAQLNTGLIYSCHGEILIEMTRGRVIKRTHCKCGCDYDQITRFDLGEWRAAYPHRDISRGVAIDLLDIGFWRNGQYEGPNLVWRLGRRATATDDPAELIDNLTAALETVMTHYGPSMPEADRRSRTDLINEARAFLMNYQVGAVKI